MSLNQTEIQPPKLNHQSPFRKRNVDSGSQQPQTFDLLSGTQNKNLHFTGGAGMTESSVTPEYTSGPKTTILDENDSRAIHNESSAKMVRKAIVDLYLNVKIRSQDQIAGMTEDAIEVEKLKLAKTDTLDIIDYIKQSIEILMHMRVEEFEMFQANWDINEKIKMAKLQD